MNEAPLVSIEKLNLGRLPSVPQVLLRLIEACHQVDVSFQDLAEIIQQDVALTAKITAVCNSPAYAQWNDDRDFNRLLVVLGLNNIKTIAINAAVHQFFSQFNVQTGKGLGTIWYKSLWCAHAARSLATLTSYEFPDEAYLAGLLHKLGQLVFLNNQPEAYGDLLLKPHSDLSLTEHERELFGAAYHEVSALVVREWDLESFLSDALLYQNEPADRLLEAPRLVRLTNFTHKLSDPGIDSDILHAEAELLFGLTPSVVDSLKQDIEQQVHKAADGLGIHLEKGVEGRIGVQVETEDVRLELARRVREFALLSGINLEPGNEKDLQEFLRSILDELNILFGMDRSILFLADTEKRHLKGVAARAVSNTLVAEFNIPITEGRSRVAQALIAGTIQEPIRPLTSNPASLIDRQLARTLERDSLLCIPLITGSSRIGVIAVGLDEPEQDQQAHHLSFLPLFATTAARNIHTHRELERRTEDLLENTRQWHQREARSIVHEINNPLGIINNYLHVLSAKFKEDPSISDHLKIIKEEIQRVGDIALRLRDIGDPQHVASYSVDINEVIGDLVEIFQASYFQTHKITEHVELDKKLPAIQISRASLKQVVTNLVKNAVEAMTDGGEIWIRTHDHINIGGREYVELSIADSGPGIPPDIMGKLFTPLDSTKGDNHSGLGLTIVKNLIDELKGSISCRGRSGGGTEFFIHLPRRLGDE
ncbi:HDOD domain-containing protein [Sedimenticola sp.]|uniref:HDOD domain-containing protein n=1 Tax=Sedimenticola sp. TaxID=1940285 RepID=UPI00258E0044|nr:HDOD domain-containing protein [Sedimenticola sp.]MCW8904205.1 HDOD domain-containing protein [Sedimenticola sp.]